jgi:predicted MFS family arabinose efflux permease
MLADPRRIAVTLAGLCTFIDLYATQSLLPLFAHDFGAAPAHVSLTVSATTFAVALVAPFVGIAADLLGRKRIIVGAMFFLVVPTVLIAFSATLNQVILGRFVQGLLLPPIFAVTVAYIGDEWPAAEVATVTGVYIAGSGLGGFLGRFLSGVVSEGWGWRNAFFVLAAITLVSAIAVALTLPREKRFTRAEGLAASSRAALAHLRNPRLLATFGVGFAVLYAFVATFTYVSFHLAAPPFNLSPAWLGSIFVVYLTGVVSSAVVGRAIARIGRSTVVGYALGLWVLSLLVTIVPSLAMIIIGLALASASGFVVQTCATSYLASAARRARSSAVGLYVTCYYVGRSVGGIAPAPVWRRFGWPGVVAVTMLVLVAAAWIIRRYWREPAPTR